MRPIPRIAQCACGEFVIAAELVPGQRRYWCRGCVGFVDAVLRTSMPRAELPKHGIELDAYLNQVTRSLTEQAMARSGGKMARAARLLGIKRTTLAARLRRMGAD